MRQPTEGHLQEWPPSWPGTWEELRAKCLVAGQRRDSKQEQAGELPFQPAQDLPTRRVAFPGTSTGGGGLPYEPVIAQVGPDPTRRRSDEAITAPRQRLDVARMFGIVVERLANLVDGLVQPLIKVHEDIAGPEAAAQFFARDHLAGTLQQGGQHLEGVGWNGIPPAPASTWKGCSWSRIFRPCLRSSPASRSASKIPNRIRRAVVGGGSIGSAPPSPCLQSTTDYQQVKRHFGRMTICRSRSHLAQQMSRKPRRAHAENQPLPLQFSGGR